MKKTGLYNVTRQLITSWSWRERAKYAGWSPYHWYVVLYIVLFDRYK